MTITVQNFIAPKFAENVQTAQFTVTGGKAIIDNFTVLNTSASNVTFAINIVPFGGAVGASNLVLSREIAPNETYICPEMVGKVLEDGWVISTLAGAASALAIAASGRLVT